MASVYSGLNIIGERVLLFDLHPIAWILMNKYD
jgi:hypothetical protein